MAAFHRLIQDVLQGLEALFPACMAPGLKPRPPKEHFFHAATRRGARPAFLFTVIGAAMLLACQASPKNSDGAAAPKAAAQNAARFFLGFDRNDYPGDDGMKLLRKDFAFT